MSNPSKETAAKIIFLKLKKKENILFCTCVLELYILEWFTSPVLFGMDEKLTEIQKYLISAHIW